MSHPPDENRRRIGGTATVAVCLLLLAGFAALSWSAARTKCPTFDEPLNTVGAWMILHEGDWRVHPDHPALWQYWSALPNGPAALRPERRIPAWDQMLQNLWVRYLWAAEMLFEQPGVDAERVVERSRFMMLLVAVALGCLMARWAWELAGPIASMVALAFFALDPNFLGHASLVKNDVALAFSALLLMYALWRLGREVTPGRALVAALAFATGFGVKFSALLFFPLAALILIARAILPVPWLFFGRSLARRGPRLLAGALLLVVFLGAAWGVIWAAYRFRFAPTRDPEARLDTGYLLDRMRRNHLEIERLAGAGTRPADQAEIAAWRPGPLLRSVLWAERNRILPQAWLYGVVYSCEGLQRREGFLLGEHRLTGWWYYLPMACLFKTPLATLAAGLAAAIAGLLVLRRSWRSWRPGEEWWSVTCLVLPFVVFWTSLMISHVSLGLRHALTVYPYAFIALGVVAAGTRALQSRPGRTILAVVLAGLLIETLAAFPDYIAFFNAVFRPSRIALLGDSNLDWGQDLKPLAAWQRRNPDRLLYLAYFGQADPAYYGITYRKLPTASTGEPGTEMPTRREPAVIAVSATHLQAIYIHDPRLAAFYGELLRGRPLAVFGGTIYVFDNDAVAAAGGATAGRP